MQSIGTFEEEKFIFLIKRQAGVLSIKGISERNQDEFPSREISINLSNLKAILNNGSRLYKEIDIGLITVLDLSDCILHDIVQIFTKLPLKELHLSKAGLKTIPSYLYSNFESLEILDISHNELKDFDIEPRCHSSLKSLNLSNNKFTDLPLWLSALRATRLENIDYSFNKVNHLKCIFKEYDFRATKIQMKNCYLRDQDLKFLKSIIPLQNLDISNDHSDRADSNMFEDLDELFVKVRWKKMRILNMNNLSLSIAPEGIVWLEPLSELYLMNNNLSWLPNGMEYLVNLEILDVSNNSLSYIPESFFLLRFIRIIRAANNHLSDFQDVTPMKYLEILDLYNNKLEDFHFSPSNNVYIDLEYNYFETEQLSYYEDYLNKCSEYRKTLVETKQRSFGPQLKVTRQLSSSTSSECSDISLTEDFLEINSGNIPDVIEEDWDEPYSPTARKHPDVTPSDDEWDGTVGSSFKKNQSSPNTEKVYNDDWIFCDAEEDVS